MSDHLASARQHLSEAADLAGAMVSGHSMKQLTRALNRCNPITVHPSQPPAPAPYGENPFEGGNVGQPPHSPQYSVGSYPTGHAIEANFVSPPLPVTEYPGDTVPPALPDPCQGMRDQLKACSPPVSYCPSFMGQPTGEVRPLAGTSQPLDTYDAFTNQPLGMLGDPNRSLNDTLRQLWLRNALQQSAQMPYGSQPSSHLDMSPAKAKKILSDGEVRGHPLTNAQRGMFGAVAGRDDNSAYSYPHNPDGRIQGPMQEVSESDFLGGRFGPRIKRMRDQLNNCRR